MHETSVVMDHGCAYQQADNHHHTDADQLFRNAQGLQSQIQHQRRRYEEQQAAHLPAQTEPTEEVGKNVAAASHVCNKSAIAIGGNGDENQPAAESSEILT
ncbi:hypothetical protein D3C87_1411670 [compost metagenome]